MLFYSLQRYLYGLCLFSLRSGVPTMMHADLLRILGNYKFNLATENAICDDYITEKLWRPLQVGSVPIVLGSPKVQVYDCTCT